jgi:putative SOS response-associated peptidase YedK
MRWGLVPSWKKGSTFEDVTRDTYNTMNARSETVANAPSFRHRVNKGRCVVIVDGFYEWKQQNSKLLPKKQPYFFTTSSKPPQFYVDSSELKVKPSNSKDEEVPIDAHYLEIDENVRPYLLLAGLFDYWYERTDNIKHATVTILTTNVAPELEWVHDRMPVILKPEDAVRWLDVERYSFKDCQHLLKPNPKFIKWFPVTPSIGSVRFQGIECLAPISLESKNESIANFFKPASKANEDVQKADIDSKDVVKTEPKLHPSIYTSPNKSIKRKAEELKSPVSLQKKPKDTEAKKNLQPSVSSFFATNSSIDLT